MIIVEVSKLNGSSSEAGKGCVLTFNSKIKAIEDYLTEDKNGLFVCKGRIISEFDADKKDLFEKVKPFIEKRWSDSEIFCLT